MTIPRIFHRIWLGTKALPEEFAEFGATWTAMHPSWEMRMWTDANLPPLANQALFDNAPSFAAKADILRYELLLRFGGVYVDTDFECLKNIEPLIAGLECFVAQQKDLDADFGRFCYVNNALMGAGPGHPLLRDLVSSLPQHMASIPPDMPAAALTGPHYLTAVIQSHPEVKIFPAKYFYPYTATERWRRHDRFPEAYAVHHWTLSDVAVNRQKPRKLGTKDCVCLSVCLQPVERDDGTLLRWVLEGLCLQTVTNFEVLYSADLHPALLTTLGAFAERLTLREFPSKGVTGSKSEFMNAATRASKAPRVLFLATDCLPDQDVVETHARSGAKAELLYAFRRIYPAEKFFPFREAVDYVGLLHHCRAERTGLYVIPSEERWMDVEPSSFSVPTELAQSAECAVFHYPEGVREWAKLLSEKGCRSVPCIYGARVTQLGVRCDSPFNASGEVSNVAQVPFQLNEKVASARQLSTAAGRGPDGRSPYVLRYATLNGVQSCEISSLQFHILEAFRRPMPPEQAINVLVERVAAEIEKRPRVLALCRKYLESFVSEGILVPTRQRAGEKNA